MQSDKVGPEFVRRSPWRNQVALIAERGRAVLQSLPGRRTRGLDELCRDLLEQPGEAVGLALATEIVSRLEKLDDAGLDAFLEFLAVEYGPSPEAVMTAFEAWRADPRDPMALVRLGEAVEAPRQDLFRRLNVAELGTATIVRLRARLLDRLHDHPDLAPVDADLCHLLSSWFNRGFLRLESIDWRSPAVVLEKVIEHEAVHEIHGWDDLHRRLAADRRCFAFFHPALPDEPLIFVEVALTASLSPRIQPLLEASRPIQDARQATTAVFYSISNTQTGLRGVSFGNFLIKQVVAQVVAELPNIRTFGTLSPLPRFAATLRGDDFSEARLRALVGETEAELALRTGERDLRAAVIELFRLEPTARSKPLKRLAERVVLAYLTQVGDGRRVVDPVAHFHLLNGANVERINLDADSSAKGQRESFGAMVNYVYNPARLEANHERYAGHGEVCTSRALQPEVARVGAAWSTAG